MSDEVKCFSCARAGKLDCHYPLGDFKKMARKDASFNDMVRYVCPSCGAWGNIMKGGGSMLFHVNHSDVFDFVLEPPPLPNLSRFRTVPEMPHIPNPFSTEFDV